MFPVGVAKGSGGANATGGGTDHVMRCPMCSGGMRATKNRRQANRHPMERVGWRARRSVAVWFFVMALGFPALLGAALMAEAAAGEAAAMITVLCATGGILGIGVGIDSCVARSGQGEVYCPVCGYSKIVGWDG